MAMMEYLHACMCHVFICSFQEICGFVDGRFCRRLLAIYLTRFVKYWIGYWIYEIYVDFIQVCLWEQSFGFEASHLHIFTSSHLHVGVEVAVHLPGNGDVGLGNYFSF
jgi:hypothetical protein